MVTVLTYALALAPSAPTASRATAKPGAGLTPAQHRALALQVALDRLGFSPGEIDARPGGFTTGALSAFKEARGLSGGAATDTETVKALGSAYEHPLVEYVVTDADMAGPFEPAIPEDMTEKAKLPALGYASPLELLAERFHVSPALLTRLNPGVRIAAGTSLHVPAVEPMQLPAHQGERTAKDSNAPRGTSVELTKATGALEVRGADGAVLMYAPVTVGSEQDPLPVGDWKIVGVFELPIFNYNPELFWDADATKAKARIAAGPNNPVGLVWIQVNKEHFGFHGTPEPSRVGRTESHGCVRLTNWDALRLAQLVDAGTEVHLR